MQLNCQTDSQRLFKFGIRPECLYIHHNAYIAFTVLTPHSGRYYIFPARVAKLWAGLIENFLFRKPRIGKIFSFSF